jgi:hypothetical protein
MRGINKELKDKITRELLNLKYDWKMKINRKIKKNNYAQTPEYYEEGIWNTKNINEQIIDEILRKAKQIREQGISNRERIRMETSNPKKFYTETPTINLMEAEFKLDEEEFRDRVSEIFKILSLCLGVKTDVEVNKIMREKVKKIKEYNEELERLNEEIPRKKGLTFLKKITEEGITKDIQRKEYLEKEIEKLSNEVEN